MGYENFARINSKIWVLILEKWVLSAVIWPDGEKRKKKRISENSGPCPLLPVNHLNGDQQPKLLVQLKYR